MMTRRLFAASAVSFPAFATTSGCSHTQSKQSYDGAVQQTFRHADRFDLTGKAAHRELARYATMAANSHNTQPWIFKIAEDRIHLAPDHDRRCPVVDPDDHHLYASLGAAAENILTAAGAFGLHGDMEFATAESSIMMAFEPAKPKRTSVFQAIPERQCTRATFNGDIAPTEMLTDIEAFAASPAVEVHLLVGQSQKDQIIDFVVAGNSAQMDDEAFVQELRSWIRFNEAEALATRDGISYRSAGSPSSPRWLGEMLFGMMFRKGAENDKYREQIKSSAGIAVFVCKDQNKATWIEAGRAYQRFALHATALGLRHAFINQPVEVPELRRQLAGYLELGERLPDLIIRFGYGEPTPRTLRRPVENVLLDAASVVDGN